MQAMCRASVLMLVHRLQGPLPRQGHVACARGIGTKHRLQNPVNHLCNKRNNCIHCAGLRLRVCGGSSMWFCALALLLLGAGEGGWRQAEGDVHAASRACACRQTGGTSATTADSCLAVAPGMARHPSKHPEMCVLLSHAGPVAGRSTAQPTVVLVMLPGGTSHALQGAAIARTLRGRGWRTAMVLPDFDAVNLESKRLLDAGLETVVFQTPPQSNDHFEASGRVRQAGLPHFTSCHSNCAELHWAVAVLSRRWQ